LKSSSQMWADFPRKGIEYNNCCPKTGGKSCQSEFATSAEKRRTSWEARRVPMGISFARVVLKVTPTVPSTGIRLGRFAASEVENDG
jgi:hypothetical protein